VQFNLSQDHRALAALACPLCGRPVVAALRTLTTRLASPVVRHLQQNQPTWRPEAGACPECALAAAEAVRQTRSLTSLQDELLLPYPVYTPDEAHLLPAAQYLDVSPHYTGRGVTIAFLDSGFYPHPDLTQPENRILVYADATRGRPVIKDSFNKPQVTSWHGMMTSCVAAGNGMLSERLYRGLATQANLVLVKTGNSSGRGIHDDDIQRALDWVIANQRRYNIRVVNISLGGDHPSNGKLTTLDQTVEKAVAQGMVVVTAAGNSGVNWLVSPASAPSAITVGGVDVRNTHDRRLWRVYPSNYGKGGNAVPKPELVAPAAWLVAPMLPRTRVHNEGQILWQMEKTVERLLQSGRAPTDDPPQHLNAMRRKIRMRMIEQKYIHPHYQHVDGTSMAAPLVSATVALMLSVSPSLAPSEVKQILALTALPLENIPPERQGAGVVHAGRAVGAARRAARGVLGAHAAGSLPLSPHVQAGRVTFVYFDPLNTARQVAVIGSFNNWDPAGFAMRSPSPGLWMLEIALPAPGKYEAPSAYAYKFLVDTDWVHDPENPVRVEDGFGGFSSILEVR
jgi:serine protease AprX